MDKQRIAEALQQENPTAAASLLLTESAPKPGTKVYVMQDPVYGNDGVRGTVVAPTNTTNPGFTQIKLENGKIMPVLSCFLFPL
jgi:hypothetical protein